MRNVKVKILADFFKIFIKNVQRNCADCNYISEGAFQKTAKEAG